MVSGSSPPVIDGVCHYTANLLGELRRLRPEWEWFWLCRRPRWFYSPFTISKGIKLIRPTHRWDTAGKILARKATVLLKPDLIHVQEQIHSFHETDAAVRIVADTGQRIVTTLHEFHIELASVRHTIELVRQSAIVIANDSRNAQRCHKYAAREADYCWWSGSNIAPPEPDWGVKPVRGLVTTFGFISAIKSLDLIYHALSELHPRYKELHWQIIGPFDPKDNSFHAELAKRLSSNWVTFDGGVEDTNDRYLRTLLGKSQIMALPFADGASLRRTTLQTAWAFGLPVVTTPPQTREPAIVDGENCLLVHQMRPDAWASAIQRLLDDKDLEKRLRAGSLATAYQFSWNRLAGLHLTLYERLLGISR